MLLNLAKVLTVRWASRRNYCLRWRISATTKRNGGGGIDTIVPYFLLLIPTSSWYSYCCQSLTKSNKKQWGVGNESGDTQPLIMMLNTNGGEGICVCIFMYVCACKFENCLVHYATYVSGHIKWHMCVFHLWFAFLLDSADLELLRKKVFTENIKLDESRDSQAPLGRHTDSFLLVALAFNSIVLHKLYLSLCPERYIDQSYDSQRNRSVFYIDALFFL